MPTLGLLANLSQFVLLVVVNAFVGATIGLERSILPLLAEAEFGIIAATATFSFVMVFGASKAVTSYFAGMLCEVAWRSETAPASCQ